MLARLILIRAMLARAVLVLSLEHISREKVSEDEEHRTWITESVCRPDSDSPGFHISVIPSLKAGDSRDTHFQLRLSFL